MPSTVFKTGNAEFLGKLVKLRDRKHKIKYVPVDTVPIFFYMKSACELYATANGFRFYRVAAPKPMYYIARGKHLWKETRSETYT